MLIISADIGEGHDLPARAVAREFRDEDPDAVVSIVNGLPANRRLLEHGDQIEIGASKFRFLLRDGEVREGAEPGRFIRRPTP